MGCSSTEVHNHCCLFLKTRHTASHLVEVCEKSINTDHHRVKLIALEELLQDWRTAVDRIRNGFSHDEGWPYFFRFSQFREDVVVALFKQGKVEDKIALVWTLVIAFKWIELIIGGVDVCPGRLIRSRQISILWYLWSEDDFRWLCTVVACEDMFWSVVDDDGYLLVKVGQQFFFATGLWLLEEGRRSM